jgi:hypothetical protein
MGLFLVARVQTIQRRGRYQNEILALLNAGAHDGDSVDGNTG